MNHPLSSKSLKSERELIFPRYDNALRVDSNANPIPLPEIPAKGGGALLNQFQPSRLTKQTVNILRHLFLR